VQVTSSFDVCKYGDQGWLSGAGSRFAFQGVGIDMWGALEEALFHDGTGNSGFWILILQLGRPTT